MVSVSHPGRLMSWLTLLQATNYAAEPSLAFAAKASAPLAMVLFRPNAGGVQAGSQAAKSGAQWWFTSAGASAHRGRFLVGQGAAEP